jgi:hypothetical protein
LLPAPVVMADQDAGGSYNLLLKASLNSGLVLDLALQSGIAKQLWR